MPPSHLEGMHWNMMIQISTEYLLHTTPLKRDVWLIRMPRSHLKGDALKSDDPRFPGHDSHVMILRSYSARGTF